MRAQSSHDIVSVAAAAGVATDGVGGAGGVTVYVLDTATRAYVEGGAGAGSVLSAMAQGDLTRRFCGEYSGIFGELKDNKVTEYEIHPEDFGLAMAGSRNLRVEDATESREVLLGVLDNQPGPAREIVIFNAGVALYAANLVDTIGAGIMRAREIIASGAARARLDEFVRFTQQLRSGR